MPRNLVQIATTIACAAAVGAILLNPLVVGAAGPRVAVASPAATPAGPSAERGRYLAMTSGCNDCHTAGYLPGAGRVPQSDWLKGDVTGWNGPWGTTYAPNLRLFMAKLSEDEWLKYARTTELRPPMPWFGLREMSEPDLRSIYRFVRTLGAPGDPAPAYLPPGVKPQGMYVQFVLPAPASAKATGVQGTGAQVPSAKAAGARLN